jgi:hypothetical protein
MGLLVSKGGSWGAEMGVKFPQKREILQDGTQPRSKESDVPLKTRTIYSFRPMLQIYPCKN